MQDAHLLIEHTERMEVELIEEARCIAIGDCDQAPTRDHLMALLRALDGRPPEPARANWDGEGVPF